MKEYINFQTILTAIIMFFLISLFNYAGEMWSKKSAVIITGSSFFVDEILYTSILVKNQDNKLLNDLLIRVPSYVNINSISASTNVQIVEVNDNVVNRRVKQLRITGLTPNTMTEILVPIEDSKDAHDIFVLNAVEKKIDQKQANDIHIDKLVVIKNSLLMAIPIIFIYLIFLWVSNMKYFQTMEKLESVEKKLTNTENQIEKKEQQLEKTEQRLEKLMIYASKMKLVQHGKLSDYIKENQFWRDTIRKAIYNQSGETRTSEKLIEIVVRTLKTYSTLENCPDLDYATLEALSMLVDKEKNLDGID